MNSRRQVLRLLYDKSVDINILRSLQYDVVKYLGTANQSSHQSENKTEDTANSWNFFKGGFKFGNDGASKPDFHAVANRIWQEVKDAVLPKSESLSATRVRTDATPFNRMTFDGPAHLIKAERKHTLFSKIMARLHKQLEGNPIYNRLHRLTNQGKEMAEDIKDKMESSDHPLMHKIQDYHESFTKEAEAAQVMREILKRDPEFNMVNFLRCVKEDVAVVIKAYLEGNQSILRQHCTDELLERLMGLYRYSEAQGTFQDSTLLFINDVEPLDAMFVEKQPVIVVTFSCQQINCVRDKFDNVVEGKEDEIQQVYYAWALEQDEHGAVDGDGKLLPPRWQLREMMIRGFHALL